MALGSMVEVKIHTLIKNNLMCAVLLKPFGTELLIPVFLNFSEMQSVLLGLEPPRLRKYTCCDLALNLAQLSGYSLKRVDFGIESDKAFIAKLTFDSEEKTYSIDISAADALALAARHPCQLFLDEDVIDSHGENPKNYIGLEGSFKLASKVSDNVVNDGYNDKTESNRSKLKMQLAKAIEDEEYEIAAKIRDELDSLGES